MNNYGPSPVTPQQALAEMISNPLYDRVTLATGFTQGSWFIGANGNNKVLTNVPQNGILAHPKFARLGGFRVVLDQSVIGASVTAQKADVMAVFFSTFVNFRIGDLKDYLVCPTWFLPAGVGIMMMSDTGAAAAASHTFTNGWPVFGNFFRLKHLLSIPPLQQFGAFITANAAVTLGASQNLWFVGDAELGREVL